METFKLYHFKDSSVLDTCIWDTNNSDLLIIFKSKAAWIYKNVPEDVYFNFINSDSSGKFFNEYIRNVYSQKCLFKEGQTIG